VHRQDQHRPAGKLLLHVAEQVEAAAPGHGEVENRHVPFELARHGERFVAVSCFTDYGGGRIGRQHLLEAVANDRMIVGYQNSHLCGSPKVRKVYARATRLAIAWKQKFLDVARS
jgi:hypothetical protein